MTQLDELIEKWLDSFDDNGAFPHLPPDISTMMARQALSVIETLEAGQEALAQDGLLKED